MKFMNNDIHITKINKHYKCETKIGNNKLIMTIYPWGNLRLISWSIANNKFMTL